VALCTTSSGTYFLPRPLLYATQNLYITLAPCVKRKVGQWRDALRRVRSGSSALQPALNQSTSPRFGCRSSFLAYNIKEVHAQELFKQLDGSRLIFDTLLDKAAHSAEQLNIVAVGRIKLLFQLLTQTF